MAVTHARPNVDGVVVVRDGSIKCGVSDVVDLTSDGDASRSRGGMDDGGEGDASASTPPRGDGREEDADAPVLVEATPRVKMNVDGRAERDFCVEMRRLREEKIDEFTRLRQARLKETGWQDAVAAAYRRSESVKPLESAKESARAQEATTRFEVQGVLRDAREKFASEHKKWELAVIRAQQTAIPPLTAPQSSTPALDLPFWHRFEKASTASPAFGRGKFVQVTTQVVQEPFSSRGTTAWKFARGTLRKQTVACLPIGSAEAVPAYNYFAYSTHSNSFDEHEDNKSRLLFKDDDGELLESAPAEEEEEPPSKDLTREQEFVLCVVTAMFSNIVLLRLKTDANDGNASKKEMLTAYQESVINFIVEETASFLDLEKDIVHEWFSEARSSKSNSRAWCMFLEMFKWVQDVWGAYSGADKECTGVVLKLLTAVGGGDHFWKSLARVIINAPTMVPLKTPVIVFESLEQATEQLSGAFCPRCFVFDCRTHGALQPKSVGRKLSAEQKLFWRERTRKKEESDAKAETKNCSEDCWYSSSDFKLLSQFGALCASCQPGETPNAYEQNPIKRPRKWRNAIDVDILKKAVEILRMGAGAPTACDVALFFGGRRSCVEVGRQMHCLELVATGAMTAEDDARMDDEEPFQGPNKKKRKRALTMQSSQRKNPTIQHRMKLQKEGSFLETQYLPCECVGQCSADTCSCLERGTFCERFCNCGPKCTNEFAGCQCDTTTRATCRTRNCPCYAAARECIPDKCKRCCRTADAVMLPIRQKYGLVDPTEQINMPDWPCENMKLQLRQKEHVCLGKSDVAGWGVFILHGARKGDFIGEYVGELITQDEADTRGTVYDQNKCSYLFNLNSEWVIDAQNRGNKLRFANHSLTPNVEPRVVAVNGDNRLAMFACRDIAPGEELFFNYNYSEEVAPEWHDDGTRQSQLPGRKPKKSAKKSS